MALEAVEGGDAPQDWNAALDHLRQSAELGLILAQASLAGLAGDWTMAQRIVNEQSHTGDWRALREAVDVIAWTRAPVTKILSASPRVAIVEGLASPEVCDWLIERARAGLAPARVYDHDTGGPVHEGVRTNSERFFPFGDRDLIFNFVRLRIAHATGLPVRNMEAPTILHYVTGQHFLAHHDYLDPRAPGPAQEIARRGQRVLTLLLCLNDDYDGGETEFPLLGKRFKGRKGNALFFWNVGPDGGIDERTLHAGLSPTRGEKWLLSQWIRERQSRAL